MFCTSCGKSNFKLELKSNGKPYKTCPVCRKSSNDYLTNLKLNDPNAFSALLEKNKQRSRNHYRIFENRIKELIRKAEYRAKKYNVPFDIDYDFIISIYPKNNLCPVFKCELTLDSSGNKSDNSPTIDRTIPEKGYIKTNVVIMSFKANRLKSNGSLNDFIKIVNYLSSV